MTLPDRRACRAPQPRLCALTAAILLLPAILLPAPAMAEEAIEPARDTASVEADDCRAMGDDDAVRPYSPALRRLFADSFADAGRPPDEEALRGGVWRCMSGHLVGCLGGPDRPCGRMNAMRRNPRADNFCRDRPGAGAVPPDTAGRDSIFSWRCEGPGAVIAGERHQPDARGFAAGAWRRLD